MCGKVVHPVTGCSFWEPVLWKVHVFFFIIIILIFFPHFWICPLCTPSRKRKFCTYSCSAALDLCPFSCHTGRCLNATLLFSGFGYRCQAGCWAARAPSIAQMMYPKPPCFISFPPALCQPLELLPMASWVWIAWWQVGRPSLTAVWSSWSQGCWDVCSHSSSQQPVKNISYKIQLKKWRF